MSEARLVLTCGLPGSGKTTFARRVARGIGVGVELHYLDVSIDELWRRVDARNAEPPWASYPITRAHLDEWAALFEAPDAAELSLFDQPPG